MKENDMKGSRPFHLLNQFHKMVRHTQTIRRQNCLSVFYHFAGLALKGLSTPYHFKFFKGCLPQI